MAQDWSRAFYNSVAWLDCSAAYIASPKVYGLCERCARHGHVVPGYIVHHKILLTPNNINDVNVTLNYEHLEYQCLECHNAAHGKQLEGVTVDGLMFNTEGQLVEIN